MAYVEFTLTELQADLKEKWETVPFWSDEEARAAINEALRMWNLFTGTWRDRETDTVTASTDPYWALSGTMTYPMRIEWDGTPLDPTTSIDLDNARPGWESDAAGGTDLPAAPEKFVRVSANLVAFWPHIESGTGTITIDGLINTPILTSGSDVININDAWLDELLGYALHAATLKEGGPRFEASKALYVSFVAAAGLESAQFRRSAIYRRAMATDAEKGAKPDFRPRVAQLSNTDQAQQ